MFKILFRKYSNLFEIKFINCLVDCPQCTITLCFNNFQLYLYCLLIYRCVVCAFLKFFRSNWCFRMKHFFRIKILRVCVCLFSNFSASTDTFILNQINFLFIKFIRIFRRIISCFLCNNRLFSWLINL